MGIIRKQAVSGTIYTYLGAGLGFVSVAILFPRILSTEEIGLLNLLVSYSLIFSLFGGLGFSAVVSRMFPYFRNPENKHNGFLFIAFSVSSIGFLLTLIALFIYSKFILPGKTDTSPLFVEYFWYVIPIIFSTIFFTLLDNYNKVLYNAVRGIFLKELFSRILIMISVIAYYFMLFTYKPFVGLYVFSLSAPVLVIFFLLLKDKQISFKSQLSFITPALRKEIIEVSLFGILIETTGIICINVDRIMIESIMGAEGLSSVGIYATAFFFGTVIFMPARALGKISSAVIADAFKSNDMSTIETVYRKTALNQYIIGLLCFVGIWVNIDNIFVLLSDKFISGKYVIFFIGLSYLSDMMIGSGPAILSLSKHFKVQALSMLLMAALVVVTNFIFIPGYGIVGAAFASFLSKLFINILRFIFLKWKYNLQPYNKTFIYITITGLIAYTGGYFIPTSDNLVISIAIKSIPVAAIFLVLLILFRLSEDVNSFITAVLNRFGIKIPFKL